MKKCNFIKKNGQKKEKAKELKENRRKKLKGKIRITNGKENKTIEENDLFFLKNGWYRGITRKKDIG